MGLFDRVRQVLAKVEKVLPGADRAADEPRPQRSGPEATAEAASEAAPEATEDELPGTAQRAQEPTSAPAPATPVTEPRRYRTHTLLPGQSLADVAEQHGVRVEDVAELNGVDPELVFAGQVFRIPHD